MLGHPAKVTMSEEQMKILEALTTSSTTSVQINQRANIILLADQKKWNTEIAEVVNLNPQQVGHWRKHWKAAKDRSINYCLV